MLFESQFQQVLRSFGFLDLNARLTARDLQVTQAVHPPVARAANHFLESAFHEALCPARTTQADVDKKRRFVISCTLGGIDPLLQLLCRVAPAPISQLKIVAMAIGKNLNREALKLRVPWAGTNRAPLCRNWFGKFARLLKNPMPLARNRPPALRILDTVNNFDRPHDDASDQLVGIEAKLLRFLTFELQSGLNQNPAAEMSAPGTVFSVFAEMKNGMGPRLAHR